MLDRDAYHRPKAALANVFFDGGQQIVGLVFFDFEVCVARNPERMHRQDIFGGEQIVHIGCNQLLDPHPTNALPTGQPCGDLCIVERYRYQPWQDTGDLNTHKPFVAFTADDDREVQTQVRNKWERMAGVECQRR